MAFKMRSGNKPAFKSMGSDDSPLKAIGKWSGWMANKQKFIGDEIEARRRKPEKEKKKGKKDKDKDKKVKDTKDTKNTKVEETTTTEDGRVEYAAADENLKGDVQEKDGKKSLRDYQTAFDDMENKTVDGETMKYNPKNKQYYADSEAGLASFESDAEKWWKQQHAETDEKKNLNIDSQTGKQSTHEVWE